LLDVIIILVAVGLGAGALGAMLGVGGGIIMVPALTFLGLPPTQVASTSLFAVTSTSASSTIAYSRQKRIDYRLAIEMAALAIPGAIIGPFLLRLVSIESFKLYFGILLALVAIYILYRKEVLKEHTGHRHSALVRGAVFGSTFGAGIISSFFGVGGGIVFVPAMLLAFGMTMQRAAPTSQLTLLMTSVAGVLTHSALANADYLYALALSAGAFVGAQVGARWSVRVKELLLSHLLGIALIAVAAKLIADWFSARS
jgi:hypothetical protein